MASFSQVIGLCLSIPMSYVVNPILLEDCFREEERKVVCGLLRDIKQRLPFAVECLKIPSKLDRSNDGSGYLSQATRLTLVLSMLDIKGLSYRMEVNTGLYQSRVFVAT